MTSDYDSILVLSFGGPEGPDEVLPFLENVVRGRDVPQPRLLAVAEHYYAFGGKSPINERTRELIRALEEELRARGPALPVYFGNRHWRPHLVDTLRRMADDGRGRALAFVTSAFSSYSGCRAYLEDVERARAEIGPAAPVVDKIRPFYDHPGYVETCASRLREALLTLPETQRAEAHVLFSAHSIPAAMSDTSDYVAQLRALSGWVADAAGVSRHRLVYQSRSGPPAVPWLEPDVCDALREVAAEEPGAAVVVAPIGFVADHMEVVWDLDHEAREVAEGLGLTFRRAPAANAHPAFVSTVAALIRERTSGGSERASLSPDGPRPDRCAPGCCPAARARRP